MSKSNWRLLFGAAIVAVYVIGQVVGHYYWDAFKNHGILNGAIAGIVGTALGEIFWALRHKRS